MRAWIFAGLAGATLLAGGLTAAVPAAAQNLMSTQEITKRIQTAYGVRVLRVTKADSESGTVYMVTVMNPGGNFNEAFQVNTLVVDGRTGRLIRQHGGAGARTHAAATDDGTAIRRLTGRHLMGRR